MTSQQPEGTVPIASWGDRALATLIDFGIILGLWLAAFILPAIVGSLSDTLGSALGVILYLVLSAAGLYFGFLEGHNGQSPGKALTGLKVVRASDNRILGGGLGILRRIVHILDGFCFIGYIYAAFDSRTQTFADKIMDTLVLRDQQRQPLGLAIFVPAERK